jgi:hypothetical protein
MKMNLGKENFKNKLKTWKQGYRMKKELINMSGFAWNESTQCVDVDDTIWDELLKVVLTMLLKKNISLSIIIKYISNSLVFPSCRGRISKMLECTRGVHSSI